ncbi:cytokinin dehydrogenase 3-like protein [Tanacetum coccineum]
MMVLSLDIDAMDSSIDGTLRFGGVDVVFKPKRSRGGRGVKEKEGLLADNNEHKEALGTNHDTSIPKVVNEVGKDDVMESFPPLSTPVTTTAGNAPGKSLYANITGKPSGKKVNVRTLFTPRGNVVVTCNPRVLYDDVLILKKWHPDENLLKEDVSIVPVWVKLHGVLVTAFNEDGLSAIATKLGTPLMLDSYTSDMCMQFSGRSSYARVMVELRASVELKDNIVMAIPKITREGHYTCNVHVEYEWKPPRCSSCKVFGHIQEECIKNTGAGEKKTVKKPSQTSRSVLVGPKMGFKPQKEYRSVPKKPNASSSDNKKNKVEPTFEVSNSNPFDFLNSIDNDGEFGTNWGTSNLVNNEATSSGSSFMNINNDGECNTPISIVESDSEVEVVFDETANLRISTSGKDGSDKGYGTNSLLEQ